MLRVLREQDYKKYEWLLEKLNLLYKPMPHDAPDGVMIPRENVERKVVLTPHPKDCNILFSGLHREAD